MLSEPREAAAAAGRPRPGAAPRRVRSLQHGLRRGAGAGLELRDAGDADGERAGLPHHHRGVVLGDVAVRRRRRHRRGVRGPAGARPGQAGGAAGLRPRLPGGLGSHPVVVVGVDAVRGPSHDRRQLRRGLRRHPHLRLRDGAPQHPGRAVHLLRDPHLRRHLLCLRPGEAPAGVLGERGVPVLLGRARAVLRLVPGHAALVPAAGPRGGRAPVHALLPRDRLRRGRRDAAHQGGRQERGGGGGRVEGVRGAGGPQGPHHHHHPHGPAADHRRQRHHLLRHPALQGRGRLRRVHGEHRGGRRGGAGGRRVHVLRGPAGAARAPAHLGHLHGRHDRPHGLLLLLQGLPRRRPLQHLLAAHRRRIRLHVHVLRGLRPRHLGLPGRDLPRQRQGRGDGRGLGPRLVLLVPRHQVLPGPRRQPGQLHVLLGLLRHLRPVLHLHLLRHARDQREDPGRDPGRVVEPGMAHIFCKFRKINKTQRV
ncbi:hypothetical protein ONE63_006494 [Megalurothrips usitatus]|uniref:Uncharacterized protein n=1 Tax=Megalurothrips usitatus TaxID=439358 RepID=A0AAV7XTL3_9NEOP|nr:hypothetical protein ONE63_006494 [Megalurothrips usitatus]